MNHKKYCLITGASSGIGSQFARLLASEKKNLVIVARRENKLQELATELQETFQIQVEVIAADLSENSEVLKVFNQIESKNIELDLLINNAGIGHYSELTEKPWQDQSNTIMLNILALTYLTQLVCTKWKKNKIQGQILNVASVAAYCPLGGFSVYAASKAYVKSFSLSLREELKDYGIKVNCLCPGGTTTEFFETSGQVITSFGEKSMMSAEQCVEIAYRAMLKNQAIIIPGFSNKLTCIMSKIIPDTLFVFLATKIFSYSVKKK